MARNLDNYPDTKNLDSCLHEKFSRRSGSPARQGAANAVGAPGVVKDAQYKSPQDGTSVSVKRGFLYTVISVNGVDVYFRRFGGAMYGVVHRGAEKGALLQHPRPAFIE